MAEKKYIIDNPSLMEEWDWEKNNELGFLPDAFSHGSHQKVWWICKQGHSWQSVISKRWNGQKCPYCIGSKAFVGFNDLATINAELVREWDFEKNTTSISKYRPFSNKKVWWKCLYGHSWQAVIAKRAQGEQCPFCRGKKVELGFNDLATTHPELTSEWDYTKNQRLNTFFIYTVKGVFYQFRDVFVFRGSFIDTVNSGQNSVDFIRMPHNSFFIHKCTPFNCIILLQA